MRQLDSGVQFVFVSSSHLTSYGLTELLVQELPGAAKEKTRLDMMQELHRHLVEQSAVGQRIALLIDEGQNLSDEALEGLCTLSNLETDEEKLLQIILVGQPELAAKLTKPSLRRIKQRIAIHYRLHSLHTIGEVESYIRHRLRVAGYDGPDIFNREALESIWYYSAGTPRLINIICDNALATACETGKKRVSAYGDEAANLLLLERGPEAPENLALPELGAARTRTQIPRPGTKKLDSASAEKKNATPAEYSSDAPKIEEMVLPTPRPPPYRLTSLTTWRGSPRPRWGQWRSSYFEIRSPRCAKPAMLFPRSGSES